MDPSDEPMEYDSPDSPATEWNGWQQEQITVPEGFVFQGFAPTPRRAKVERKRRKKR